ncbi:MAG: Stp1/IreP family PP2C-type Ser/Thr phosphatase, partial [Ferruginibacter sp.]
MATNNIMLEVAAKTNTGMVREANEDNFVVTRDCTQEVWIVPKESYVNSDAGTVLVVADGMGGLNAGEVASKIAVDSMKEELTKLRSTAIEDKNIKSLLTNAIINAHKKIAKTGKDDPETEGMGSTIVVAWINDDKAHIGWVGDSRCYVCRNGKLMQLSKDHSYVQSLIDKGELTREQAFLHPESNIIMQSLGDSDHAPKPDYIAFSLANDDVLVLCSDGLNSMVRDDVIEKIVDENKSLADGTQMLIDEANHEGGHDNITVLMAKVINGANNNLPVQKITAETEISDSKIQRHP